VDLGGSARHELLDGRVTPLPDWTTLFFVGVHCEATALTLCPGVVTHQDSLDLEHRRARLNAKLSLAQYIQYIVG
jgi:hypothetical protein